MLGRNSDEVKICAVDTRKFPMGQFARDKSLIQAYICMVKSDPEKKSFSDFRLGRTEYDNGEYLSQGLLHHDTRSCVTSLHQLQLAGLYKLYPELAEPGAQRAWTNRVRDLRSLWSVESATRQHDIECSGELARACFSRFKASDIALVLLAFKNRKLHATKEIPKAQENHEHLASNECRPQEVQRYSRALKEINTRNDYTGLQLSHGFYTGVFEEYFEYS